SSTSSRSCWRATLARAGCWRAIRSERRRRASCAPATTATASRGPATRAGRGGRASWSASTCRLCRARTRGSKNTCAPRDGAERLRRAGSGELARDREPVGDREHHGLDAPIRQHALVELPDRDDVLVLLLGPHHVALPEHVVGRDQAAGPQALHDLVPVDLVALLVGVDE